MSNDSPTSRNVSLFATCLGDQLSPDAVHATVTVLDHGAVGRTLTNLEFNIICCCCGCSKATIVDIAPFFNEDIHYSSGRVWGGHIVQFHDARLNACDADLVLTNSML